MRRRVTHAARELDYAEREYLTRRLGHCWEPFGQQYQVCRQCARRQKRVVSGTTAARRRTAGGMICPKARKPNRWRLHYRRWQARQVDARTRLRVPPGGAGHLLQEIQALEATAAHLPQDQRTWAGHPVARRYRRLLRRWWALPTIPTEVAQRSSTWDLPLTAKGRPAERDLLAASATARRATAKVEWHGRPLHPDLPQFARQATHAIRKIRPDLFDGYTGSTQYTTGSAWDRS